MTMKQMNIKDQVMATVLHASCWPDTICLAYTSLFCLPSLDGFKDCPGSSPLFCLNPNLNPNLAHLRALSTANTISSTQYLFTTNHLLHLQLDVTHPS